MSILSPPHHDRFYRARDTTQCTVGRDIPRSEILCYKTYKYIIIIVTFRSVTSTGLQRRVDQRRGGGVGGRDKSSFENHPCDVFITLSIIR